MNRKVFPAVIGGGLVVALTAFLVLRNDDEDAGAIAASGTVEATEADLGFQAAGRIDFIAVNEGNGVTAGQVIAQLEQSELNARRAMALAQLESAQALLREMERGARPEEVAQARSAVDAAREQMEEAGRVLERTRRLEQGGAASREQLDQAQTQFDVARAQYDQAREQLQLVQRGPRGERLEAQRAVVKQAEAAIAQVDAAATNTVIRAPFNGVVTVRHREQGETVAPGAPVLTIMNPHDRWVRIYVREDQVGGVTIGERAEIRSDFDPERTFPGRVTFIATEAEFTPRNVQTTEERVKLVYAVKVAIAGDSARVLKPGMPADVTLRTGS